MSHWVVTANGTVSGPFARLDAWIEHTRLVGKGAHANTIKVVQANSADEARVQKPL